MLRVAGRALAGRVGVGVSCARSWGIVVAPSGVAAGATSVAAGGYGGRWVTGGAEGERKRQVTVFGRQQEEYDELGEFKEPEIPAAEKVVFGTFALLGLGGVAVTLALIGQQLLGGSSGEYTVFDESLEVVRGDERARKLLGEPISGAGGHPDAHRSQRQHVNHAVLKYEDGREGVLVVWYATGTRSRALVRSTALANDKGGYDLREVQLQEMTGKSRRRTWGTYTIKM